ncbi:hypothetical protein LXM94_20390 [Rhizobium sp. TRM95111]|uniref:hypothetical protein n=1 Tax=Rhizobium alarense TaxID=2846851 RepID=UPI001F2C3CE8|nr:hypothetical protein [Rhizobium alarense]MCF3642334.1 hypothetical protein [Rhizobium alarense]
MFLDDETTSKKQKARETRAVFYMAITALAACVVMVFGLMSAAKAGHAERPVPAQDDTAPHALLKQPAAVGFTLS